MKKLVDGFLYIKVKGTFDSQIISFFFKYMYKRNGWFLTDIKEMLEISLT